MKRTRAIVTHLLLLTLPLFACDAETPPVDLAGLWQASPARFDSMTLTLSQIGSTVSGVGVVQNDVADRITFTISGHYPEITFSIEAPDHPGLGYYDGSSYRGTLRDSNTIVGTLRYSWGQVVQLIFTRRE
jgi:hypothetical protein